MNMRKLFGLGAASLVAQALGENTVDRRNSFNRPSHFARPADRNERGGYSFEAQRNIPKPWEVKRFKWGVERAIADLPSVVATGVAPSGPTRTIFPERVLQVPPGRILPGGPIRQNLARMLRGQAQPPQAPQPFGGASISFDDEGKVDEVYFREVVRIGPEDTEIVAIDGAAVHEARERQRRRPELERFFAEGLFGVKGEIWRRLGIGR